MRIAILDDDATQLEMIRWVLSAAGHHCHTFNSARAFQHDLRRESFDLLVLDWMLPDNDGLSVMRWVRSHVEHKIPILFVTSRTDEESIVQALSAGADDYMIKPLRRAELVARVGALLRRAYPEDTAPETIEIAGMVFEPKAAMVNVRGQRINLTHKEFDLALLLFRNMGKPLSRSHIQESVWGHEEVIPSRTMDTHVSRVRSKMGLRPEMGFRLAPVYSYGYRLEVLDKSLLQPVAKSAVEEAVEADV
jgi:DNA-binding response OmpR family regulator